MKCFFCESTQTVVVGGAVLESTDLFHDVLECLECGGVMLVAPKQIKIANLVVFSPTGVAPQVKCEGSASPTKESWPGPCPEDEGEPLVHEGPERGTFYCTDCGYPVGAARAPKPKSDIGENNKSREQGYELKL